MSTEQLPKFAHLTANNIYQSARRIKPLPAHLKASWKQLNNETPLLADAMRFASTQFPQLWGAICRPAFMDGVSASHLLLRNLSDRHSISFPKEASTGDTEHDLVASYGAIEFILESNATFHERIKDLTTDSDLLAETTSVRYFQSLHPLWFSEGVSMAARYLRRSPQYFDGFLADGRLFETTTSTPVAFANFNPDHVMPVEAEDCDRFAMFTEGFGTVTRLILDAEVKRDFEQQFPE